MNVSLIVNISLLIVKIYAFWASRSKAILASAADSLVDIASQLVIAYAEYKVYLSQLRISQRFVFIADSSHSFPHLTIHYRKAKAGTYWLTLCVR
jgi:divalent metal cation (Fe/Co/Zn/Cd) transporter